MSERYYKLTANHSPKIGDGVADREFFAVKLYGPFLGVDPAPDVRQYGVWWSPEEDQEITKKRISDMVFAVVKELGGDGGNLRSV